MFNFQQIGTISWVMEKKVSSSWQDLPICSLDEFAVANQLYPNSIVSIYSIFRDQYIKRDVENLSILDGKYLNIEGYVLSGMSKSKSKEIIFIPLHLDADVNIQWFVVSFFNSHLINVLFSKAPPSHSRIQKKKSRCHSMYLFCGINHVSGEHKSFSTVVNFEFAFRYQSVSLELP